MVALNVDGRLCFWFPRQSYWQGFNVRVYSAAGAGRAANRRVEIKIVPINQSELRG